MTFDYARFKKNLRVLTQNNYTSCLEKLPHREIVGYALYSDVSAMTLSASLNTRSHLAEMVAEEPEYAAYYRWSPGEWTYELLGATQPGWRALNEELKNQALAYGEMDNDFLEHRTKIFTIVTEVLEELRRKFYFRQLPDDCVLLFAVSDFPTRSSSLR